MPTPLESRIKNIQRNLKVTQTGVFDMPTCIAFEMLRSVTVNSTDLTEHLKAIQRSLGYSGKDVDGVFGVGTVSRLEMLFDTSIPALPAGTTMVVSKKGLDIIINAEISSKKAYDTKYQFPVWPKGDSGITIGIGYDLGMQTAKEVTNDWGKYISPAVLAKLLSVTGIHGAAAANALTAGIKSIVIPWDAAIAVFYAISVPKFAKKTRAIYPEIFALPPDAQSAILSLVYNRGTKLSGSSRAEMLNMVTLIKNKNLKGIASEFRKMKRLWPKADQRGLVIRREAEAVLIENATWVLPIEDYIFV